MQSNVSSSHSQYYSSRTEYRVRVKVVTEAEFYLKIDRNSVVERIFEGMPSTHWLEKDLPLSLQFNNGQDINQPLSLIINL